jgi:hypothetical protein
VAARKLTQETTKTRAAFWTTARPHPAPFSFPVPEQPDVNHTGSLLKSHVANTTSCPLQYLQQNRNSREGIRTPAAGPN